VSHRARPSETARNTTAAVTASGMRTRRDTGRAG
jgi:hypothetical protein